jgi:hypothetical protein
MEREPKPTNGVLARGRSVRSPPWHGRRVQPDCQQQIEQPREGAGLSRRAMSVALYWFRTGSRRRWMSYLTISLLIGLVGGIAVGSLGAARRTQSSFNVFLSKTDPRPSTRSSQRETRRSWSCPRVPPSATALSSSASSIPPRSRTTALSARRPRCSLSLRRGGCGGPWTHTQRFGVTATA